MKITYTGRKVELAPAELKKVEAAFGKVGKVLDGKQEREAHVVLSQQRHLNRVEVTVQFHGHDLVGESADSDLFTALNEAIGKLEKQATKVRAKWRDSKRTPRKDALVSESEPQPVAAAPVDTEVERRIFHVNHHKARKPMTLDEAIMEMESDRDYIVYRDASTDRLAVLVRRRDGNFDLVEA